MCIVNVYILHWVILFAGMGRGEMNMRDRREIDKEKLNDYQRRIYEVAERLIQAFRWHDTPQDHNYWSEVYDNLIKLVKADIAADKHHGVR